jgi:hypothetical protein
MSCLRTYLFWVALLAVLVASCRQPDPNKQPIDWTVTLDHQQKTPYGASIAFETLPEYFPGAKTELLSRWFRYTSIDDHMYGGVDSSSLLVLLGLNCYITDEEWVSLLKFAKAGNEIFLLSSNLDVHLMRALQLGKVSTGREEYPLSRYNDGSYSVNALRLASDTTVSYGYRGRPISAFFQLHERMDTASLEENKEKDNDVFTRQTLEASVDTTADILGTAHRAPDFLRFKIGQGHITLHAAPLVMSNYFLLQKDSRAYLDSVWHSFPANISRVYWNEYYKRNAEGSSLGVLLKYPATRWAFIIALCTLLLYVLFGMKRLQRIVPVVPPIENASVSFIETVGKLYFNKGNHENLAEKMIQHFFEWVRSNYHMDTTQLNEAFAQQLANKSGRPLGDAERLVSYIHQVRLGTAVNPDYLYQLHKLIQSFYKAP